MVYAAGHKNIYRYEDSGETDRWVTVISTEIRASYMVSFRNYVYCTQNYFNHLYRFQPDIDDKLESITYFTNAPATICNLGKFLHDIHTVSQQLLGAHFKPSPVTNIFF